MEESIAETRTVSIPLFLSGGGNMGEYIRNYDWCASSIGSPHQWPQPLKTAISIMLNANVAMYIAWGKRHIQFYNDSFQALLGAANKPQIGGSSTDSFPDVWNMLSSSLDEVLAGRAVHLTDVPVRINRSGYSSERFFNFSISPIIADDGAVLGIFATITKSAERQLKNLVRRAPVGIVKYHSADFIVELANDQALEMWGKTFEEVIGKSLTQIFPIINLDPYLKEQHQKSVRKFLSGETYVVNEQELTFARQGKQHTGYYNYTHEPVRDAAGKVTGILAVAVEVTEQVLARRRIEESGRELINLAHAMPQLVWIAESDGTVTFYNDRVSSFAGASKMDNGKWRWEGLLHPDDLEDTSTQWKNAVANGTVYEKEHRVLMKSNEYRWHLSRAFPITDTEGKVIKWYGTATDIHEIKTSKERIEESEERLRFAIEATGAAIFDYNLINRSLYWSEKLKLLCGFRSDDVITAEMANAVIHPDDRQAVRDATRRSRTPGSDGRLMLEHRIVRANDGGVRWLHAHSQTYFAKIDFEEKPVRVAGVAIDITERKKTEDALAQTTSSLLIERERLEIALRTGQLGVYEWKIGEPTVWWSPETYAVFGVDPENFEVTLENFTSIIHPQDRDELWRKTQECIDARKVFSHEYRIIWPDGTIRWVANMSNIGVGANGEAERITGVTADITARKEAELTRARLSAIVESSADAIYSYDFQGNILSWNKSAEHLYGYSQNEIIGKNISVLIDEDFKREALENILPAISEGRSITNLETKRIKRDGSSFDALLTASPIRNVQGAIIAASIIVRDITEVKRSQEKVRFAAALTGNIVDAVIATDTVDYRIISWNKGAEQLYGWKAEEVLGQPARAILPTVPVSGSREDWLNALRDHGFWKGEVIQKHKNGTSIHIQSSLAAVTDDRGSVTSYVTVNRDITQIRKIEQELSRAKEQLELTFKNTPSGIFRFNSKGVMEYVNPKGAELMGFNAVEDVMNMDMEQITRHVDERFIRLDEEGRPYDPVRGSVYQAFTFHQFSESVSQLIDRKTQRSIWILTSSTPVFDEQRNLAFVLSVSTDITSQKLAEEALRRSEEHLEKLVAERTGELKRSNEDLQQFAHVASHDLKEPIRKVKTFASRLEGEKTFMLDEKARTYLGKIQSAADRMLKMVEGVLSYSTINAVKRDDYELIDLNQIMRSIEMDLEVLLLQKAATIQYDGLPVIEGVPIRIYQLFYNLVINSVKFSRPGVPPHIRISAESLDDNGVEFARIKVQDNGIGFESSHAEVIFDTFARLHSLDKYEGTGLGLALCKKIVERHGGTIEADAVVNQGATFTIRLPLRAASGRVGQW
jgi:PAS domain S-box-containing protein